MGQAIALKLPGATGVNVSTPGCCNNRQARRPEQGLDNNNHGGNDSSQTPHRSLDRLFCRPAGFACAIDFPRPCRGRLFGRESGFSFGGRLFGRQSGFPCRVCRRCRAAPESDHAPCFARGRHGHGSDGHVGDGHGRHGRNRRPTFACLALAGLAFSSNALRALPVLLHPCRHLRLAARRQPGRSSVRRGGHCALPFLSHTATAICLDRGATARTAHSFLIAAIPGDRALCNAPGGRPVGTVLLIDPRPRVRLAGPATPVLVKSI